MAKIAFSGKNEKQTILVAEQVRHYLTQRLPPTFELHPVIPAGHAKVKDKFRFQFLVKAPSIYALNREIEAMQQQFRIPSSIRMFVDIDPTSTYF